jgi:hypothetical protein
MEGRLLVECINGPFLYELKGTPAEYSAGIAHDREGLARDARERQLLTVHPGRRGSLRLIREALCR